MSRHASLLATVLLGVVVVVLLGGATARAATVDPPQRIKVQKLDRSELAGMITSFDEAGFEFMDLKKQTSKVAWDELPPAEGSWDEKRRVADGNALHHEDIAPTSLDEPRPADPNAAWLADLYAQFIDDPEMGGSGGGSKKKKRGDTQALDVAFKAQEVDAEAKVSTLKRLMGALKKI